MYVVVFISFALLVYHYSVCSPMRRYRIHGQRVNFTDCKVCTHAIPDQRWKRIQTFDFTRLPDVYALQVSSPSHEQ